MKALIIITLFISSLSFGQKLKFKVVGQKDTTVFLVKYYGKGLYYADTAEMKNGAVEFNGALQKPGILALLLPGQKYFEFIYNNEDVQLETQGPEYVQSMKIKKSEENRIFYDYMKFLGGKREEANKISDERTKLKKEDPNYKVLTDKIDLISKEVIDYQKNLFETNNTKLVGKIVKMGMEIDMPTAPIDSNGKQIDSLFTYHYYRDHFFDNVDLNDERLVNTPIFHSKLETYFGKTMMYPHWDTIIKYAFEFCDRLDPKTKTFEYCVSWITSTYEKSNIMGMDKVFVMMGDRYYCSKNTEGKSPATWVKEDKLKELCEKVNTQKNLVMGVRPPNISLRDTSDSKWFDYYSLKSEYTILYFWDADCGHCKKTTPKMQELYKNKFKDRNIEIFSVCKAIGDDFPKWKTFVKENNLTFINVGVTESLYKAAMEDARQFVPKYTSLDALNYQTTFDIFSTPRIFVLDKDKKIIAKQLSISQLEDMMDKLQHKEDSPKLFPPDPEEDEQMTH
jgi:thiol-disulfide isomerase/thioredoxin